MFLEHHVITTRVRGWMLSASCCRMRRTGLNGWSVPAETARLSA